MGICGDKQSYPLGVAPFGMLTYTEDYMMVFIAADERTRFTTDDIRAIPPEQIITDFSKFETYCGYYDVDFDEKIISHRIENSKYPNQIGTVLCRKFNFKRDQLILRSIDSLLLNNTHWLFELLWNRQ
nr:lipocalin-like domain-containing protein [Serratia fonticola]